MSEIAECICQQGNKSLSTKFENNTQYSNLILIDICWKENVFAHFIFENGTVGKKLFWIFKNNLILRFRLQEDNGVEIRSKRNIQFVAEKVRLI